MAVTPTDVATTAAADTIALNVCEVELTCPVIVPPAKGSLDAIDVAKAALTVVILPFTEVMAVKLVLESTDTAAI